MQISSAGYELESDKMVKGSDCSQSVVQLGSHQARRSVIHQRTFVSELGRAGHRMLTNLWPAMSGRQLFHDSRFYLNSI